MNDINPTEQPGMVEAPSQVRQFFGAIANDQNVNDLLEEAKRRCPNPGEDEEP